MPIAKHLLGFLQLYQLRLIIMPNDTAIQERLLYPHCKRFWTRWHPSQIPDGKQLLEGYIANDIATREEIVRNLYDCIVH
jgi:hypothetical protein